MFRHSILYINLLDISPLRSRDQQPARITSNHADYLYTQNDQKNETELDQLPPNDQSIHQLLTIRQPTGPRDTANHAETQLLPDLDRRDVVLKDKIEDGKLIALHRC